MCKVQMLRALVKQRLTAAAEEIFGLFERTISEYEEEVCRLREDNERQQKLLDAVLNPQLQAKADDQQQSVVKEEFPPEQQDQEDQEDPEPPHIKEEQEELWSSQEEEQLQGLEEADIKFTFTAVPVKSEEEEDEEKPQSSQLHHRQTEQMETEADGEDCGGPEPEPNVPLQPATQDKTSSTPSFGHKGHLEKPFSCSFCGKKVASRSQLTNHVRVHTGEKPFTCSVCKTSFATNGSLVRHMRIHTGEKPFSCSVCGKRLANSSKLTIHLRVHTGEKPFTCSVCRRNFSDSGNLVKHMRIHTGEKPYSCSVCGTRFRQKQTLRRHLAVHTGEKLCPRTSAMGDSENTSVLVREAEGDEAVEILVEPFSPADLSSEGSDQR